MASFQERIIHAANLDIHLHEKVGVYRGAMGQPMWVVALASIAGGIGTTAVLGFGGILIGTIVPLIVWYVWAFLATLLAQNYYQSRRPKRTLVNCFGLLAFQALPA